MKRSISILLCLALIFSSFTFASAVDWSTTDQNNLQSIKNAVNSGGGLYNMIANINSALSFSNISLANITQNIYNSLNYRGYTTAYWLATLNDNLVTLMGWIDPNSSQSMTGILNQILNALVYTDAGGLVQSWLVAIEGYNFQTAERLLTLTRGLTNISGSTSADARANNHYALLDSWNGSYTIRKLNTDGTSGNQSFNWYQGSPIGNLALLLRFMNDSTVVGFNYVLEGFDDTQTFTDWTDLSSDTFSPETMTQGLYGWLSNIQTPVARLSYVLASDERIEAQELAAANEQAVVDNFIDSTGDGSVPTSSFSDVSGLSSGVTSNLSTDASPAQIWDIFNSDHGSWFSQETANQLDTTTRTRGSEFETPLLDQQMEEIYKSLGGGK